MNLATRGTIVVKSMQTFTFFVAWSALLLASGCAVTTHSTRTGTLGVPRPLEALEAVVEQPGPLEVETLVAATWHVPLSGMLNFDDPQVQAAGLEDRDEPIQLFLHAVHHPTRGTFLIESGVESALVADRERAAIRGLVASVAGVDDLHVKQDTRSWLASRGQRLSGVFLTHMHLDHILGLPDVPAHVPIYTGPGEAQASSFENLFVQGTTDRELEGHLPLEEWPFVPLPASATEQSAGIAGLLDIFGDGSLWALYVPGHTPGSTAYLARTVAGPVLFTGDACHTVWGWEHGVEPGTFSSDRPRSRRSLLALLELVKRHPSIDVRLGHQSRPSVPATHEQAQANRAD
ncbi:MAG TPA: MBL fold metallo-hydrolase, partial [Polyangiaceae bacterium]|nr:MBL fold metallo-hydrolase [Polyangiaceae bacterium]